MEMNVRRGMMRMGWDELVKCSKSIRDYTMMLVVERFKEKVAVQYAFDDEDGVEELMVNYKKDGTITLRKVKVSESEERLTPEQLSRMLVDSHKDILFKVEELERQYAKMSLLLLNLGMI